MRTPECSGQCNPGYICPPGSRSSTERLCGSENFYCPTGSGVRLRVSKGYYTVGATLSTRESQHKCEPGYYCKYGNKRPCPAGRYGNVSGIFSENCTGVCPKAHYCPSASVNPTPCPAGTYGETEGLKTKECSGKSPLGSYAPIASSLPTLCPPGRYGSSEGLTSDACSTLCADGMCIPTVCEEGYYCPLGSSSKKQHECGSSAVYCPRGSNTTTPVSVGYYTIGGTSNMTRTSQLKCEPGFFCVDGVKHHCPPGSYGAKVG